MLKLDEPVCLSGSSCSQFQTHFQKEDRIYDGHDLSTMTQHDFQNTTGIDVAEVFTPPRAVRRAQSKGLVAGWSMDKLHIDCFSGKSWDLSNRDMVKSAWRLLYKTRPGLLILSPPCTVFSRMQNLNEPVSEERWNEGVSFINLCVAMCRYQLKHGRHFILEQPAYAKSWDLQSLSELTSDPMVHSSFLHMCQFGLQTHGREGSGPALKPTRVVTSSAVIAGMLARQCPGDHTHVKLEGGRRCSKAVQ